MAFAGAWTAAAITFALLLQVEALLEGAELSVSFFLFCVVGNCIVALPVAILGGIPLWMALKARQVRSPWVFALCGAALGLGTALVLVKIGLGAPSDRPMSFAENLLRTFQLRRIGLATLSGTVGGGVFWRMAVKLARVDNVWGSHETHSYFWPPAPPGNCGPWSEPGRWK